MTKKNVEQEILIPLEKIKFDPTQPRKAFHTLDGRIADKDAEYIKDLAGSIKKQGLIQAITVQEQGDGTYLVLVGECRARAHLLLGEKTIRARVYNEPMSPARRLIYQIAENVDRKDLTDEELAESIRFLMEKGKDGKPMKQAEIAKALDKSEGWVSRYVRFGDDEVKRVWVQSGIAQAVEIAYHLSNLSKPLQLEILRRVGLPEGDKEHLEIPFTRKVIDQFREQDKIFKSAKKAGVMAPAGVAVAGGEQAGGHVAGNDAIDLALQNALIEGRASLQGRGASLDTAIAGGYQLPPGARAEILGSIPIEEAAGERESMEAPVNCRVSVANLETLLDILQTEKGMLESARGVRCEVSIPGPLAKLLANKLVGVIVDDQQVSASLQMKLAKLGED
jgi:ParB/RepB/Spo0J family partition protein